MKTVNKFALSTIALVSLSSLSGCAAISTEIQHHNLKVQTKMSDTIFLPPIADNQKLVYVQVKNTSDQQDLNVKELLVSDLQTKGYIVVTDPASAYEMVQVNILQVGETNRENINSAMSDGFGGILGGAALSASVTNGSLGGGAVGGIVGGIGSAVADALVKDVMYSIITDVQVSVKSESSVQQTTKSNLQQGTATHVMQTSSQTTQWQAYQTRVISYADKVNLKFEEAEPKLTQQVADSIAGILED